MLTQFEQSKSHWGGKSKVIDTWLDERQALLVAYCDIIGLSANGESKKTSPTTKEIKRFCQLLMDYISASHFEIFHDVTEQCQDKGPEDKAKAVKIFPKLNKSTDLALTFNDDCADKAVKALPENFDLQLAELGRAMEERFNYEDLLLAMLHKY